MLANRERMLEKMDEFNLDAVIASHPENVSYVSDLQSHSPYMYRFFHHESFALFARSAQVAPAMILSVADVALAARYPSWIEEVYPFGNPSYIISPEGTLSPEEVQFKRMLDTPERRAPSPGLALVRALKQKGLEKGRIGLDERGVSPITREQITTDLPQIQWIDAFELFRIVRMVKTPEELERLRTVGLLNERAAMGVVDKLAESVSEAELTQHFLENVAREGAVFEFWNTVSGTPSSLIMMTNGHSHPRPAYRLKKGDMFRYDGGSIYNLYHSDAGGCAVLGPPSQRQKTCYQAIHAGMEKAMELLRPGVLPSRLFRETVAEVEKAGLKDYSKMANFVGHGIGIEARDYPILTPPQRAVSPFLPGSYDLPFEENMVISVEVPYVRELGLGGFQIEYTLLVTKNGCEKLYPHERELVVR
jgi:Xaa-Pro dipeptidase